MIELTIPDIRGIVSDPSGRTAGKLWKCMKHAREEHRGFP
jgi:hypothetical protein